MFLNILDIVPVSMANSIRHVTRLTSARSSAQNWFLTD